MAFLKSIIFEEVKTAVFILLSAFVFLTVQPLIAFASYADKECCSGTCCKKKDTEEKKSDENKNCNPLTNCPYCNLVSVPNFVLPVPSGTLVKQVFNSVNDNFHSEYLPDCWHPPNFSNNTQV